MHRAQTVQALSCSSPDPGRRDIVPARRCALLDVLTGVACSTFGRPPRVAHCQPRPGTPVSTDGHSARGAHRVVNDTPNRRSGYRMLTLPPEDHQREPVAGQWARAPPRRGRYVVLFQHRRPGLPTPHARSRGAGRCGRAQGSPQERTTWPGPCSVAHALGPISSRVRLPPRPASPGIGARTCPRPASPRGGSGLRQPRTPWASSPRSHSAHGALAGTDWVILPGGRHPRPRMSTARRSGFVPRQVSWRRRPLRRATAPTHRPTAVARAPRGHPRRPAVRALELTDLIGAAPGISSAYTRRICPRPAGPATGPARRTRASGIWRRSRGARPGGREGITTSTSEPPAPPIGRSRASCRAKTRYGGRCRARR